MRNFLAVALIATVLCLLTIADADAGPFRRSSGGCADGSCQMPAARVQVAPAPVAVAAPVVQVRQQRQRVFQGRLFSRGCSSCR